ncbi:arginine ABC transporter permease [Lachnospiraceae bacterium oral taxon 500]|nr:arginine ABC transporter permease [Lachnospiraceae bacterium oral taxon 500]
MDFVDMVAKYYPYFLKGTVNTLLLSLLATTIGFLLGMILALLRINSSKNWFLKLLRTLAGAYIELIRGTPLLVQLLLIFNSTTGMSRYAAGVIALSLNSAAYVAEIIRAGIQSVDKGQMEAARSLGLSSFITYKEIILPQAVKNILPALGNEFIVLIKETAIVSMVGIVDLMYGVSIVQSKTYKPVPPLIVALLIYLALTLTLSKGVKGAERRLNRSDGR